jgi:deoxyribonuclease V
VGIEGSSPASTGCDRWWPERIDELERLQVRLADAADMALATDPWLTSSRRTRFGGCFVAPRRGVQGPGRAGDRVWAAAVVWERTVGSPVRARRVDRHLRGTGVGPPRSPRQADDVVAQTVVTDHVRAPYRPGFLATRDGAVLAKALAALEMCPDVVIVDASGVDHPRRAGLAVHLGAATGLPTVGVTRRPLVASGPLPELHRGARGPLLLDGRCVAYWVSTRDGAQPLVAHAGWRTSAETAADLVLETSTPLARTPVPLQEARRVAREARSLAADD